jgi:hypothetical protein
MFLMKRIAGANFTQMEYSLQRKALVPDSKFSRVMTACMPHVKKGREAYNADVSA